jgi:hypothetical protein
MNFDISVHGKEKKTLHHSNLYFLKKREKYGIVMRRKGSGEYHEENEN